MRRALIVGAILCCIATTAYAGDSLTWPFPGAAATTSPSYEENSKLLTVPVVGPPLTAASNSKLLTVPVIGPSLTAASNSKLLTVPVIGPSLTAASNSKLLTVVIVNTAPRVGAVMRMPLTHW